MKKRRKQLRIRDKESFPQQNSTWDLTFAFSALVLLILSGALLLAGAITLILYNSGKLTLDGSHMNIFKLVLVLAGVSLVLGAIFAQIFSKLPLRPFRILISATKRMSKGDFSARIHLSSPILPYEFTQLTESFNAMAEELGNTELLRSDFIHNFSHEFKTPINSLRGFAKLLKNPDLTEEERQEYLDIIISESERLSMLSTNVLNLCKIENQTIAADRQPYDAAEQLRRTLLLLEPKWSKKELDLDPDLPDSLLFNGNQDLLNHLWMNLLDNAIKFSAPGTTLTLGITTKGNKVHVSIRNVGETIPAEELGRVFDRFHKTDHSRSIDRDGVGLGLYIVKTILDNHKENITVTSEEGITEFTFTLTQA